MPQSILLIEDEEALARFVELELSHEGYSVEKVFAMKLSRIYPLLVQKAERKGRTRQEVDAVIHWLMGERAMRAFWMTVMPLVRTTTGRCSERVFTNSSAPGRGMAC